MLVTPDLVVVEQTFCITRDLQSLKTCMVGYIFIYISCGYSACCSIYIIHPYVITYLHLLTLTILFVIPHFWLACCVLTMAGAGLRIGIELELLLSSKQVSENTEPELDLDTFAAELMASYVEKTDPSMPMMALNLQNRIKFEAGYAWALKREPNAKTDKSNQCRSHTNPRICSFPYLCDVFCTCLARNPWNILYVPDSC